MTRKSKSRISSSNYLQRKSNAGPKISVTGGNMDKSDIFIGVVGVFVIALVVILGGGGGNKNTQTQQQTDTNGNVLVQQSSPMMVSQAQSVPVVSTTSTHSASNNQTDKPDASIEASLQAGSDQTGPPSQMNGGGQNLKEIHGQKFVMGESMRGEIWPDKHTIRKQNTTEHFMGEERNTADMLMDQAKKVKQDLTENAVADILVDQKKKVKQDLGTEKIYGIPLHANVGGVPTGDPFDAFSEPEAQIQTQPNIDFTGYGHTNYTAGNVKQYDRVFYPSDGEVFFYRYTPLQRGMAKKKYNELGYGKTKYQEIVGQNKEVQAKYNTLGFYDSNPIAPITMKRAFPDNDFLPNDVPNFFSTEYMQAEGAIGRELGETGHSFEERTLKSGLSNTTPAPQGTPLGQGSGAFTKGQQGQQQAQNKTNQKQKVRASVNKILKLFDRLFSEEIFPDAVVDVQDNGKLYVKDGKGGRCILLARYYEYVESSVKASLGLGRTGPLVWAKNIELSFESIEKNKIPLRAALTDDCHDKAAYMMGPDGSIKSSDGKPIEIDIPWDKDQTVLVNHVLKIGNV